MKTIAELNAEKANLRAKFTNGELAADAYEKAEADIDKQLAQAYRTEGAEQGESAAQQKQVIAANLEKIRALVPGLTERAYGKKDAAEKRFIKTVQNTMSQYTEEMSGGDKGKWAEYLYNFSDKDAEKLTEYVVKELGEYKETDEEKAEREKTEKAAKEEKAAKDGKKSKESKEAREDDMEDAKKAAWEKGAGGEKSNPQDLNQKKVAELKELMDDGSARKFDDPNYTLRLIQLAHEVGGDADGNTGIFHQAEGRYEQMHRNEDAQAATAA